MSMPIFEAGSFMTEKERSTNRAITTDFSLFFLQMPLKSTLKICDSMLQQWFA
jgi:hypothetical protein